MTTGFLIHYLPEVESTQDYLKEKALAQNLPLGYTVYAGVQRQGRGRRGRSFWMSPAGGLPFSTWIPAVLPPEVFPFLTVMAGVCLCEALSPWAKVYLRWPNDLVSQEGKKLAGILTEAVTEGNNLKGAVIGIGINLYFSSGEPPQELRDRATSLEELWEREKNVSAPEVREPLPPRLWGERERQSLMETWLRSMAEELKRFHSPAARTALFQRYNALLLPELRSVTVMLEQSRRIGYIIGIHPEGFLRFRERHSGEEFLVPPGALLSEDSAA